MKRKIGYLIAVGIAFASSVWAQTESFTPSPEQIEIFKKLPKEQQQALAQKYGFELSSIGLAGEEGDTEDTLATPYMLPRPGTNNDYYQADLAKDQQLEVCSQQWPIQH